MGPYFRNGRKGSSSDTGAQNFGCDPVSVIGQHDVAAGYANVREIRHILRHS